MDAVVKEEVDRTAEVTDKPVEKGEDISDHMKQKPFRVRLSGSIVNDAPSKLEVLKLYQKEAKLLKYVGRNVIYNVVLLSLSSKHSANNAKGFDYDITLQYVNIAHPESFEVSVSNPDTDEQDTITQTKVKTKTNVGRQQVKTEKTTSVSNSSSYLYSGNVTSGGGGAGGR